jgi:hypothetical protein
MLQRFPFSIVYQQNHAGTRGRVRTHKKFSVCCRIQSTTFDLLVKDGKLNKEK